LAFCFCIMTLGMPNADHAQHNPLVFSILAKFFNIR
jgi:hypothetical protein